MDMSPSYISASSKNLSDVPIVFDHFHLIKMFNDKPADLRRELYHEATDTGKKVLKGTRWLLLKNSKNLKEDHNERLRLDEALKLNASLAAA